MYLELLLGSRNNELAPIEPEKTVVGPIFAIDGFVLVTHGTYIALGDQNRLYVDGSTGSIFYNGWYYYGYRVLPSLTADLGFRLQTYDAKLARAPSTKTIIRQLAKLNINPSLN